jgi:uncharacterized membrane protein YphA (DoxX/SURF4 family)
MPGLYFNQMRRIVLIMALVLSALLGSLHNLVSADKVAWLGSPKVFDKPSGWPSLSMGQGMAAGVMVAYKDTIKNAPWIMGGLAVIFLVAWFQKQKRKAALTPWFLTVLRLLLAAMFLAAAWPKFKDAHGFATLVAQYQFLPSPLVNPFALALPAFEIIVALGLIFTPWEREFGVLVLALLSMFIIALGQALARDLGIACGCFDIEGAADAGETWFSLLRDVVLILPSAWLMAVGRRRWLWQIK